MPTRQALSVRCTLHLYHYKVSHNTCCSVCVCVCAQQTDLDRLGSLRGVILHDPMYGCELRLREEIDSLRDRVPVRKSGRMTRVYSPGVFSSNTFGRFPAGNSLKPKIPLHLNSQIDTKSDAKGCRQHPLRSLVLQDQRFVHEFGLPLRAPHCLPACLPAPVCLPAIDCSPACARTASGKLTHTFRLPAQATLM